MKPTITFALNSEDSASGPDRAPGFADIALSAEASEICSDHLAQVGCVSLEILASLMQRISSAANPDIAMEFAGVATNIARELMRGRSVSAYIA